MAMAALSFFTTVQSLVCVRVSRLLHCQLSRTSTWLTMPFIDLALVCSALPPSLCSLRQLLHVVNQTLLLTAVLVAMIVYLMLGAVSRLWLLYLMFMLMNAYAEGLPLVTLVSNMRAVMLHAVLVSRVSF